MRLFMDFRSYLYIAPEQVRFITVEDNYLVILEARFWLLWWTFYGHVDEGKLTDFWLDVS